MKIAFVANTSWNIYNFRRGLVHSFISNGDDVVVFAPFDEYTPLIQHWGVTCIDVPLKSTGSNPLKDISFLSSLVKHLRKEKPKVVLSFTIKANIYSSFASRITGVPVIANVSGLGTVFLVEGLVARVAFSLYRAAFRFTNHVFFQNQDDQDLFLSVIPLKSDRYGILPGSGINLKEHSFNPINPSEPLRIIMIARLIIEKGVRDLASAAADFAEDPDVTFTLVGRFDENHSRSIARAELDHWVGKGWLEYFPHSDDVSKLICEHELVVLPSYREGTPRTLLEGAAHGRVLLASDVPGCREVIKNGKNGYLFEVQNSNDLAQKIRMYQKLSVGEKKQMARNSRTLVENRFDESIVIDMYQKAIHRIKASSS